MESGAITSFQVGHGPEHQLLRHLPAQDTDVEFFCTAVTHNSAMTSVIFKTHHTDFSLLAGARWADQSLQLIPDALVVIQNLRQLFHKVLGLPRIRQVPYSKTEGKAVTHHRPDDA